LRLAVVMLLILIFACECLAGCVHHCMFEPMSSMAPTTKMDVSHNTMTTTPGVQVVARTPGVQVVAPTTKMDVSRNTMTTTPGVQVVATMPGVQVVATTPGLQVVATTPVVVVMSMVCPSSAVQHTMNCSLQCFTICMIQAVMRQGMHEPAVHPKPERFCFCSVMSEVLQSFVKSVLQSLILVMSE